MNGDSAVSGQTPDFVARRLTSIDCSDLCVHQRFLPVVLRRMMMGGEYTSHECIYKDKIVGEETKMFEKPRE